MLACVYKREDYGNGCLAAAKTITVLKRDYCTFGS